MHMDDSSNPSAVLPLANNYLHDFHYGSASICINVFIYGSLCPISGHLNLKRLDHSSAGKFYSHSAF